jgi:hypothetical protein
MPRYLAFFEALYIGYGSQPAESPFAFAGYWKGQLDELKILDRALAPAELASLAVLLPGDYNHDGTVDAADFVVWRKNPGGVYTQDDFNTWRANFGRTATFGSGSAANLPRSAIPEPATLTLIFCCWIWRSICRKLLA